MTDPKIPEAAIEAVAIKLYEYETGAHVPWDHPKHHDIRVRYRESALGFVAAVLPHIACSCFVISDVNDNCPQHGRDA